MTYFIGRSCQTVNCYILGNCISTYLRFIGKFCHKKGMTYFHTTLRYIAEILLKKPSSRGCFLSITTSILRVISKMSIHHPSPTITLSSMMEQNMKLPIMWFVIQCDFCMFEQENLRIRGQRNYSFVLLHIMHTICQHKRQR